MDHYYGWSATIAASQKDGQLHMYTWTVKAGHILVIPLKLAQSSSPSSTCSVEIEQIPPSSPSETMWASTIAGSDCGVPTCEAAPKTIHSSYAPAAVVQAARHQVTACQDTTNNNLRKKTETLKSQKAERCGIGSLTNRAHWTKSRQIRKTTNLAQNTPRTKSKFWAVSEAIED